MKEKIERIKALSEITKGYHVHVVHQIARFQKRGWIALAFLLAFFVADFFVTGYDWVFTVAGLVSALFVLHFWIKESRYRGEHDGLVETMGMIIAHDLKSSIKFEVKKEKDGLCISIGVGEKPKDTEAQPETPRKLPVKSVRGKSGKVRKTTKKKVV